MPSSTTQQYRDKLERIGLEFIDYGRLFNKVLPVELLLRLPLPFVRRLRDIRIKQMKEEAMEREQVYNNSNGNMKMPAFNGSAMEDLMDELT